MDAGPGAIDGGVQLEPIFRGTPKTPVEFVRISSDVLQIPEFVFLPIMPEHGFTKDETEWHFVYKRFQRARACARAGKMRMGPSPEVAMPVSAVVSLKSDPQRAAFKATAIEHDLATKDCVGMRGS